jgi:hypothetical protein
MEGFMGVGRDELGDVDGLDVVQDVGAHDFLFVGGAVTEVVSCRKIAPVFRVTFLWEWKIEVGLTDVILTVYFFLGETRIDYAKEASVVYLKSGQLSLAEKALATDSVSKIFS